MSDPDAKAESNAAGNGTQTEAEDRYRYIGFEVFPGRVREFWRSDSERNAYIARVRETAGRFIPLSRSNSFVASSVISPYERIVLSVTSLLMVVAPFLPWFSFTRGEQSLSYSGVSVALGAGAILDYFAMGPGVLATAYLLLVGVMCMGALFGLGTLYALYAGLGGDGEAYIRRLRRVLAWHYVPILGWVVFLSVAAVPTEVPFAVSLGLSQVQDSLNIASLANSSSVGLWLPFAAMWVNAIKGNDL